MRYSRERETGVAFAVSDLGVLFWFGGRLKVGRFSNG
jgi:hypothetical protein